MKMRFNWKVGTPSNDDVYAVIILDPDTGLNLDFAFCEDGKWVLCDSMYGQTLEWYGKSEIKEAPVIAYSQMPNIELKTILSDMNNKDVYKALQRINYYESLLDKTLIEIEEGAEK